MPKRQWKRLQPTSQHHAIRLCLDYALAKHRRSVSRVSELVGTSEWAIYKWMSKGSLPSDKIRPFEFACGCTYVTQYIAASAHKLVVDIPKGASVKDDDLLSLQTAFNEAVNLLSTFHKGGAEAGETIAALTSVMSQIAGHRENVSKSQTPELALFDEFDA